MFLIAAEEADCPVGFLCDVIYVCCFFQVLGPGWLNELGSWISKQLIQAYHQYGVVSRPAL